MNILVIGDSCKDVFIYGDCDRLAPEAPVPVIKPLNRKENPGMASNVVENLKKLGAKVNLITNKNSISKIRYMDERYNQMVLRVDENDSCDRININDDFMFYGPYDAVIISDYNKGFLEKEDIKFFSEKLKCPVFLDTKKYLGNWCHNIDFIKINHQEHQKNYERLPNYPELKEKLIVTKGKHGCEYKGKMYPTEEVPVKDVSGAGDTFIAGLVYEYVKSNNIEKAISFAQVCTTRVVQKIGVATV
jgi:bifunctional ADP-heptose synthase (sugar kinase/adenylyltransferase)